MMELIADLVQAAEVLVESERRVSSHTASMRWT